MPTTGRPPMVAAIILIAAIWSGSITVDPCRYCYVARGHAQPETLNFLRWRVRHRAPFPMQPWLHRILRGSQHRAYGAEQCHATLHEPSVRQRTPWRAGLGCSSLPPCRGNGEQPHYRPRCSVPCRMRGVELRNKRSGLGGRSPGQTRRARGAVGVPFSRVARPRGRDAVNQV